jgi:hypothetical protein
MQPIFPSSRHTLRGPIESPYTASFVYIWVLGRNKVIHKRYVGFNVNTEAMYVYAGAYVQCTTYLAVQVPTIPTLMIGGSDAGVARPANRTPDGKLMVAVSQERECVRTACLEMLFSVYQQLNDDLICRVRYVFLSLFYNFSSVRQASSNSLCHNTNWPYQHYKHESIYIPTWRRELKGGRLVDWWQARHSNYDRRPGRYTDHLGSF